MCECKVAWSRSGIHHYKIERGKIETPCVDHVTNQDSTDHENQSVCHPRHLMPELVQAVVVPNVEVTVPTPHKSVRQTAADWVDIYPA